MLGLSLLRIWPSTWIKLSRLAILSFQSVILLVLSPIAMGPPKNNPFMVQNILFLIPYFVKIKLVKTMFLSQGYRLFVFLRPLNFFHFQVFLHWYCLLKMNLLFVYCLYLDPFQTYYLLNHWASLSYTTSRCSKFIFWTSISWSSTS